MDATVEDVAEAFLEAARQNCKGITIYRYGSRRQQVLNLETPWKLKRPQSPQAAPAKNLWPDGTHQHGLRKLYVTINSDEKRRL